MRNGFVYFTWAHLLERSSYADKVVSALIEKQRRLVNSTDLDERLQTLWIAARLDKALAKCTDHEIGALLSLVEERFAIFEPEFGLCEHARRRLLLRGIREN